MKKKIVSLLSIIATITAFMPVTANAKAEDYLSYEINEDGSAVTVTGCKYEAEEVVIPETIDGLPVTRVKEYAFYDKDKLKHITFSKNISSIGDCTVAGCNSLENIEVDKQNKYYTSIDGNLFDKGKTTLIQYAIGKSDEEYIIPEGVVIIGEFAFFEGEALKNISLPDGLTSIGDNAFYSCKGLLSIELPKSMTRISALAFGDCGSLKSINIQDMTSYLNIYIEDYIASPMLCAKEMYVNGELLTELEIPKGVKRIPDGAFYNCGSLSSVEIPDSVEYIGDCAFFGCESLTAVTIPENVKGINSSAFGSCKALKSIDLPDTALDIGDHAFRETAYYNEETNWSDDVLYIGRHLIRAKKEISGEYKVKEGTITLGDASFADCKELKSVKVPEGVINLGNQTFAFCEGMTKAEIPQSITDLGGFVFQRCVSLKDITLPESLVNIGYEAFESCNELKNVVLPENVQQIGNRAFRSCDKLASITIPSSVRQIGGYAFANCYELKNVYYEGSRADWDKIEIKTSGNEKLMEADIYYGKKDDNVNSTVSESLEKESVANITDGISVLLNGKEIEFDVPPQIINDRTMVPLRAIFEALGAEVEWRGETQNVIAFKNENTISLMIGSPVMYFNGYGVSLDSPTCIIDDRTLVPIRAVSWGLDAEVEWDEETQTVLITD